MDGTGYVYLALAFLPTLCAVLALSLSGAFLSAIAVSAAVFAMQSSLPAAATLWCLAWILALVPPAIAGNRRRSEKRHREMMKEMRAARQAMEKQQAAAGENGPIVYSAQPKKRSWWGG